MNEKFRKNFYDMFYGFTICFDFFPQVEGDKVERLSERSSCVPMVARLEGGNACDNYEYRFMIGF